MSHPKGGSRPKGKSRPKRRGHPKRKSVKTSDEIVAYELQIAGSRKDAERAAAKWDVKIRILPESPKDGSEVWAICAQSDVAKILAWHNPAMPHLQAGRKPTPGMLMRISQPPEGETLEGDGSYPHQGQGEHDGEPLVDPDVVSTVEFDEL